MKKLFTAVAAAITLAAALPAIAGPDWTAIEHARSMPRGGSELVQGDVIHVALASATTSAEPRATATSAVAPQASASTAVSPPKCEIPDRLVLPLDHGPRAQTTPYLNQQRKERYDAQVRACKEVASN